MAITATQQDVVSLLTQDHEKVRRLLKELQGSKGQKAKQLLQQIKQELEVHTTIEEEIVYPEFRKRIGDRDAKVTVQESLMEHHVADFVMKELEGIDSSSPEFEGRCMVLKEAVEHHAKDEEKEMFPRLRKNLSKQELQDIGQRVAQRKEELQNGGRRSSGGTGNQGTRSRSSSKTGGREPTKQELYKEAQKKKIEGRSEMTKEELMRALNRR